jgi:hypothetical protein
MSTSSEGEEEIPVKKSITLASKKKDAEKGNVDIRGFFVSTSCSAAFQAHDRVFSGEFSEDILVGDL